MGGTEPVPQAHRGARRSLDRERLIADALVDVASELRLTDAAELVAMIRHDHAAKIVSTYPPCSIGISAPEGVVHIGPRNPPSNSKWGVAGKIAWVRRRP